MKRSHRVRRCSCTCQRTMRHLSISGFPLVLICTFILACSRVVTSLRGSRASRLRVDNNTRTGFPSSEEGAERRKLAEVLPGEGEQNEPLAKDPVTEKISYDGESKEQENMTEHAMILKESRVDLHNLSLPENYGLELGNADPVYAAHQIMERLSPNLEKRMMKVFQNTKTQACRQKIATHFSYFVNAIGKEVPLPFAQFGLENSCYFGRSEEDTSDATTETVEDLEREEEESWGYQPPRNEAHYVDDPSDLNILYGVLAHSDADAVIRLVNTLYEEGHTFVIHVDGKEAAEDTQKRLIDFAASRASVYVLSDRNRVRVNWGGFSMVNATLQVLRYAFAHEIEFHKFAHLAESTYPVRSNSEIRRQLADYPIDANFMHVIKTPTNPHEDNWHYFVECDDAVHRIYRLPPLRWSNVGIDLMTSSQWFILSRDFAKYLADAAPGTLVHDFLEYAQHMVVADEQFFGTILRHTEFCHKHQNSNFLFLEFGNWEDTKEEEARDPRKCIMPDPNHCGRSPTSLKEERIPAMGLSRTQPLFARKFAKDPNTRVKDVIDDILRDDSKKFDTTFKGDGLMLVVKDTIHSDAPLCLGLGGERTKVNLVPCFHHGVRDTFDSEWQYGGVTVNETPTTNRWRLGSCTFDGKLERTSNGEILVAPGKYSKTGPLCTIEVMGGEQRGGCLESSFSTESSNNLTYVSPCNAKNQQIFSFGTGSSAPRGAVVVTTSSDQFVADSELRGNQPPPVCLGFRGAHDFSGEMDDSDGGGEGEELEEDLYKEESGEEDEGGDEELDEDVEFDEDDDSGDEDSEDDSVLAERRRRTDPGVSKHDIAGPILAMECTDDGVVEWLIIPYIIDNQDDDD